MRREFISASVIAMLGLAGCAPKMRKPTKICPGAESVFDSLSSLRSRCESAVGMKANGQCRLRYYTEGKPHKENLSLRLWANPPVEVRLQGDASFVPKAIVLGSNEREFWLSIRPKEVSSYWWGEWAEQDGFHKLPLNPEILLEALGIVEIGGEENWSLSNEGAFDVLTKRNDEGVIIRRMYIHSCTYLAWRFEYFDTEGEVVAAAELYKYKKVSEGFSVPTVIKIVKRAEGDKQDSVRIILRSVRPMAFTEEKRKVIFRRPPIRGFKHVLRIVGGEVIEQPQ